MKKVCFLFFCLLCSISLFAKGKREMRAVWIATVKNIDWPSSATLTSLEQQQEIVSMLDRFQRLKINAIFLQVRPCSDSFYSSELEPLSMYLTGSQGLPLDSYYDPLHFIIEEAHKRCIEVHAWMNPYRVAMTTDTTTLHPEHLYFKKPYLFVEYGGKLYFDPAYDETREFLNKVVADVVKRYDVDAIHFDDYFYPYRVANKDFPDQRSFAQNPRGFHPSQKDDWRRNNVNLVIAELQQTIKSLKPWVEFGISPFGVWRNSDKDPNGSQTKAGMTNYDDLYADILKWLQEGSIDYLVPQLYWEIGKKNADYAVLIDWWNRNACDKNLYIGLFASGLGVNKPSAWHNGNELVRQMHMNEQFDNVQGVAFYSAAPFLKNPKGLLDSLTNNFYQHWAMPPISTSLVEKVDAIVPKNIRVQRNKEQLLLVWDDEDTATSTAYYVVYAFKRGVDFDIEKPKNILCFTAKNSIDIMSINSLKGEYVFGVTAVNRYKKESKLLLLENKSFHF